MAFTSVASTVDFQPNQMKAVKAGGKSVLLANIDGAYYAIGNICMHMQCTLTNGKLKGEIVECPCHGSQYNVKTGAVVRGPALKPEPKYDVKTENGQILVSV
jgi:nitrite reductase/ring-hydroxylating ferredoxin subunit